MAKRLVLSEVMKCDTHWADPKLVNPCTEFFVDYCIENFPAEGSLNGVGDSEGHFYSWVNDQLYPRFSIPPILLAQMWELREQRKKPWLVETADYPLAYEV